MSGPSEAKDDDALLRALRELPRPAMDAPHERRTAAAARAAFANAFAPLPWHARFGATLGRAAVPAGLAAVVVLYLTWAFSAASALVR